MISLSLIKRKIQKPSTGHPAVQDFNHLGPEIRVSDKIWAPHEHDNEVHKVILANKKGLDVLQGQPHSREGNKYSV